MVRVSKPQEVMGWKVAASLFLIAVGGGSYLIGFLFSVIDQAEFGVMSRLAVVLSAPFVLVGGSLLLCDMGQKSKFYYLVSRPGSSWMSRGAFFTALFFVLNLIYIFTGIWPTTALLTAPAVYLIVGIIASILAIFSLVYTGFLLGAVKAIPFWSSSFLPWLFLISGLSTGTMATSVFFSIYKLTEGAGPEESLTDLAHINLLAIILEAIVLSGYLGVMRSRAADSVKRVMRGELARGFWGGVVVAALILPLAIEALKTFILSRPASLLVLALLGGVIGLIGGYMLRHVVVYGGTRIPLNVQGHPVAPPPEKCESKVMDSSYQSFQKA